MSLTRVAVYGSLRLGMGNDHLLRKAVYIKNDIIEGMGMVSYGGYPACDFTGDDSDTIVVELYDVDDAQLSRLDRLEGCNPDSVESPANYYSRREVETVDGEMAWVYFIPECLSEDASPRVVDGDWTAYRTGVRDEVRQEIREAIQ